jgi:CubicO group peptidase (beta-lactamase class C family)
LHSGTESLVRRRITTMSRPERMPHRILVLFAALLSLQCASCVFARIFYFNVPSLAAPGYFDQRPVLASSHPLPFARTPEEAAFAERRSRSRSYPTFDDLLARNDTRAIVVLHHDAIVYERYFGEVTAETRLPSFSMSKTFAAVLVGCAQADGLVASVDQRLVSFVPELAARPRYGEITLDHLLQMTSGIDFAEESAAGAMLYYTKYLSSSTYTYDVRWPPGQHYEYGSINAQLLWQVLHRRLGDETVTRYFQDRLWERIGAERSAAWALDSEEDGVEKFAAGLSATARDYARLGVLFQHRGRFADRRVIEERWVDDSLAASDVAGVLHTTDGAVRRGRYQWFLTLDGRSYFAKGYHGQYIFVNREHDVVVVRFGEGYGDVDWTALFTRMAESL